MLRPSDAPVFKIGSSVSHTAPTSWLAAHDGSNRSTTDLPHSNDLEAGDRTSPDCLLIVSVRSRSGSPPASHSSVLYRSNAETPGKAIGEEGGQVPALIPVGNERADELQISFG
jgi:hypothetical protein